MDNEFTVSFEFFPPKTPDGQEKLKETRQALNQLNPEFFSVTYGAAGSTRETTVTTILEMVEESLPCAAHLSCIGASKHTIQELLELYQQKQVKRIVALRGDLPEGQGDPFREFLFARDLVKFIREQTGNYFHIEVAAYPEFHPESKSFVQDITHFKDKVDAGADSAITQYFYNIESYYRFVEETFALGIDIPIIPGIMPITHYEQLLRFSQFCGADIPRWLSQRLEYYSKDPKSLVKYGIDVVTQLCSDLIDSGAPGLHFYTLNKLEPTQTICHNVLSSKSYLMNVN